MNTYTSLQALMPQSETIDFDVYLHAFPALRELEKTPQDPIHHAEGDVWTHKDGVSGDNKKGLLLVQE